jgi:D-beta-D-heptose 7-phosphate kinase/D-beta-D-heptose 1-phosphate adenosyltransferase
MDMNLVEKLIALDAASPKTVMIVGDSMWDDWVHGRMDTCQERCPKFVEGSRVETPGGAANAARQLEHWKCEKKGVFGLSSARKIRFLVDDQNVFRHDLEEGHGIPIDAAFIRNFDALLISDYMKGSLKGLIIREAIDYCRERSLPVVSDCKRAPEWYAGSVMKICRRYYDAHQPFALPLDTRAVLTQGSQPPVVLHPNMGYAERTFAPDAPCRNHIGAGDCFSAHLTLALAHGFALEDAAAIAHCAGQVYVQHIHARPPWPHEIAKAFDPVRGKVVPCERLADLRKSIEGRIVWTNGVFRLPHAGHAWLLAWAKKQGDVLVVGVNDDASAAALRPGQRVLPLAERVEMLGGLECVDWIVPFSDPTPTYAIAELRPDMLVKGPDYRGQEIPGEELVLERLEPPDSPYANHASDLIGL